MVVVAVTKEKTPVATLYSSRTRDHISKVGQIPAASQGLINFQVAKASDCFHLGNGIGSLGRSKTRITWMHICARYMIHKIAVKNKDGRDRGYFLPFLRLSFAFSLSIAFCSARSPSIDVNTFFIELLYALSFSICL